MKTLQSVSILVLFLLLTACGGGGSSTSGSGSNSEIPEPAREDIPDHDGDEDDQGEDKIPIDPPVQERTDPATEETHTLSDLGKFNTGEIIPTKVLTDIFKELFPVNSKLKIKLRVLKQKKTKTVEGETDYFEDAYTIKTPIIIKEGMTPFLPFEKPFYLNYLKNKENIDTHFDTRKGSYDGFANAEKTPALESVLKTINNNLERKSKYLSNLYLENTSLSRKRRIIIWYYNDDSAKRCFRLKYDPQYIHDIVICHRAKQNSNPKTYEYYVKRKEPEPTTAR